MAKDKDEVRTTMAEQRWQQIKQMRERRDGAPPAAVAPAPAPAPTPAPVPAAAVVPPPAEQARNSDGTFAKVEAAPAPAPAEPEKPKEPVVAAAPPPPPPDTTPKTVAVKIDGVDIQMDPALAAAFQQAEAVSTETAAAEALAEKAAEKEAEKERQKQEVIAELEREGRLVRPKTPAELAADRALADAAERAREEANAPKEPDDELLLTNKEEYRKQKKLYDDYRLAVAMKRTKEEVLSTVQQDAQRQARNAEIQGRAQLREQFYTDYPVLRDSAELADIYLARHIDAVIANGKLARVAGKPQEAERLKRATFAACASEVTKKLVKLASGGKAVVPPAPPPPNLVASAPVQAAPAPKVEAPKEKEKFQKGSVSALLSDVQKRKRA